MGGMYRKIEPGASKANGCILPSDIYLHSLSPFPSLVLSSSHFVFPPSCHWVLHTVFRPVHVSHFSYFTHIFAHKLFSISAFSLHAFNYTVCHQLLSHYPQHQHVQWLTQAFIGYSFFLLLLSSFTSQGWLNAEGFWCATESVIAILLFVVHGAFWRSSTKISNQKHFLWFRNILVQ